MEVKGRFFGASRGAKEPSLCFLNDAQSVFQEIFWMPAELPGVVLLPVEVLVLRISFHTKATVSGSVVIVEEFDIVIDVPVETTAPVIDALLSMVILPVAMTTALLMTILLVNWTLSSISRAKAPLVPVVIVELELKLANPPAFIVTFELAAVIIWELFVMDKVPVI